MERDMDLVRKILFQLEEAPYEGGWVELDLEGRTENEVAYHVALLNEAGLVRAVNMSSQDIKDWKPTRLTWQGHEFLEAAREDSRWEAAKKVVQEKGGGLAFAILKELLIGQMRDAVLAG